MSSVLRYIAKETLIGVVINALFSALFMVLVFGRRESISLWGPEGLAVDFVPQTFVISAMSVIVPTLITRRRIRRGVVRPPGHGLLPLRVGPLWRRVLLVGVTLVVVGGGIGTGLLSARSAQAWMFWDVFPFKVLYGAAVALVATPIGLIMVLSEPASRM